MLDLEVLNAWSSWAQYQSQSQERDSVAARFSSAREGRCRWTMRCRVSSRARGSWRDFPEGNHDGRSRVRSICVSARPVMNLRVGLGGWFFLEVGLVL
jgi:hypothetical protein